MVIVFFLLVIGCRATTVIALLVAGVGALALPTTYPTLICLIAKPRAAKQIRKLVQLGH